MLSCRSGLAAGAGLLVIALSAPAFAGFGFLSGPAASPGATHALISWENEFPGDGQVFLGTDPGSLTLFASDGTVDAFTHDVEVLGLTPSTQYFYLVHSANSNGDIVAESDILTFVTAGANMCTFDAGTGVVNAWVDGAVTLNVAATGIRLDGVKCGTATPANTEEIVINGSSVVDRVNIKGNLGPGRTAEAGNSEIEIRSYLWTDDTLTLSLGAADDHLVATGSGIDVGGDGDEDVTLYQTGILRLRGGDGNDILDCAASFRVLYVYGDGGDDILVGSNRGDSLYGGAGSDDLDGGPGADRLDGGDGDDTLVGGDGNDRFLEGAASNGADSFAGGAGRDTLDYGQRTLPLTVTIGAGTADDGEAGELDDVAADVDNVTGGSAADLLVGSGGNNTLTGGAGNDQLDGGTGFDRLYGGDGDDLLINADGVTGETVDCGAGTDEAGLEADVFVGCEITA